MQQVEQVYPNIVSMQVQLVPTGSITGNSLVGNVTSTGDSTFNNILLAETYQMVVAI